jgi:hypothetical protein
MAAMRRSLVFVLLAACGDDEPPAWPPPPPPEMRWLKTQPPGWDLELSVPWEWKDNYEYAAQHVRFAGAGDADERLELHFGWKAGDRTLDAHAGEAFGGAGGKTLREGTAEIAGMAARYRLRDTGGRREIEYCFVGHGHAGTVRGSAPAAEFARHAPLLEEAARRLRYSPQ